MLLRSKRGDNSLSIREDCGVHATRGFHSFATRSRRIPRAVIRQHAASATHHREEPSDRADRMRADLVACPLFHPENPVAELPPTPVSEGPARMSHQAEVQL